jgi:hypothetical protein
LVFKQTIELKTDTLKTTYHLSYKFLIPDTASNRDRVFTVMVTNVGGKTFSSDLTVTMDGDFTGPSLKVNGTVDDGTVLVPGPTDKFDLNYTIQDNRRLSYFTIKESTLGLSDSVGNIQGKTYTYVNATIVIPQKVDSYNFIITYADSAGNKGQKTLAVKVNVSWDFAKLYLADVTSKELLTSDLFGVPMLIKRTAAFTYEAKYFAEVANTPVRFVAQKGDFNPNCFGIDPANSQKLKNGQDALPIMLPDVGYYKITLSTNPDVLTYAVEKFDPMTDASRPALYQVENTVDPGSGSYVGILGLIGSGFPDCPNMSWSPAQVANYPDLQLKQNATYLYRWSTTVAVSGNVQFIIGPEHPWGWWPNPFWRFDTGNDPETTILEGGTNVNMTIGQKTTYKFVFDQYLNRAKMIAK